MKVVRDDLWLCPDCTIVAVNDDASGIDSDEQIARIERGLENLGPNLVPADGHREFSSCGCDCCGSRLAGEFSEFAILGEENG